MNVNRISRIGDCPRDVAPPSNLRRLLGRAGSTIARFWATPQGCEIHVRRMFPER